jgi:hypothetical protein
MDAGADWEVVHREICSLGRKRAEHEHALGQALLRAQRARVWEALGMATLFEYAERFVGLRPRQTEERLRVAAALEDLPLLEAALWEGHLHYSAVRELTRVVRPETEEAWIEAVKGKTVNEIASMVSTRDLGDLPEDPERKEPRRHRVVLEVSAETYATYREAQAKLCRDSDASLSEEDGLLLMARAVLGGPNDAGRSSYQIRMTQCSTCLATEQEGKGAAIPVEAAVAEMASCDAQRYVGTEAATQKIPPTTRRFVVARQNGRCAVPGCAIAVFTDAHHITFRSEGGTHDPDQLCVLCTAHHRAVHRGKLRIEGTWSSGIRFFHADGSEYGHPAEADVHRAKILADVHLALCTMGFKDREARKLTAAVCPRAGANMSLQEALRAALKAWRSTAPSATRNASP